MSKFQIEDRKSAKVAGFMHLNAGLASVALAVLMLVVAGSIQAAESKDSLSGVVNLNTASPTELQLLPGVGEKRAAAIVDARKQKGGFKSVEELEAVKGVGPAMMERLRPHLTLTGKTTARER